MTTFAVCVWLRRGGKQRARQLLASVPPKVRALAAAAVVALFVAVHPHVDQIDRGGSDRNEALNIAATSLLDGDYPYSSPTYLGNPISPMPGAVLLATPFVLLGDSAYQNVFWLAVAGAVIYAKASAAGTLVVPVVLLLSPVVMHEYLTGGDLLANSLYVLVFILGLLAACGPMAKTPDLTFVAWSMLLGVGLSSRANFALLLPLIGAAIVARAGWRHAVMGAGIVAATAGAVTLPFYLHAPSEFTPLETVRVLAQFSGVVPVHVVIPAIALLLSISLAGVRRIDRTEVLLGYATAVLAVPSVGLIVVGVVQRGTDSLALAGYGLTSVIFAAGAWCAALEAA